MSTLLPGHTQNGIKAAKHGGDAAERLSAVGNDADGSYLAGNGGDDTLGGGRYNDILVGGEGNDQMFGGDGADTFRFYGQDAALDYHRSAGADMDFIRDLDFSEGDRLDFRDFSGADENGLIRSWDQLAMLVEAEGGWEASPVANNGNLSLFIDLGDGVSQTIVITGGWAAYETAVNGLD
jgi:hypothetical protein